MFVLLHRIAYEGDILLGVYSTHELAEQAYRDWSAEHLHVRSQEMVIYEAGVDSPAEMRF